MWNKKKMKSRTMEEDETGGAYTFSSSTTGTHRMYSRESAFGRFPQCLNLVLLIVPLFARLPFDGAQVAEKLRPPPLSF
ncbi:hypothetical protein OUZ56_013882 [Daphnia magna]|uniref:Uncharacterized protein n=1 Tax=Daphnia magna TaxID=35525 RepID=A0ABQ9Z775_9CRUS|nr:hypothetical protein OUZ56_013882 [Daphnia magna]